ncbi:MULTISPECIES: ABC transporter ATP-binding protein [Prochlorococcus]|uniref:ABC transporter ATP-binding protein n=1 Tax=Prochlorococcus TaxID=1218 RepID=UPI0013E8C100|nr:MULTISPECIES: ABC transporter ATP-binding protein [Prochlorococcus]
MIDGTWAEFKNLNIWYEHKRVLNNINLKLRLGENTVLIGTNGSGKSTLIKTIARIKYPIVDKESFIKIFGKNHINIWELRTKIGFLFSEIDTRIKGNMLTKDIILSGYQGTFGVINRNLIGTKEKQNLEELMNSLNLIKVSKYYSQLSDGQKRRVLIARSIINNPLVLALDEPTNMLDLRSNYELLNNLSNLSKNGITLLYTTNNIENIIKETNRVIFLKEGEIILDGTPEKVITSENISNLYDFNIAVRNIGGYWRTSPA